MSSLLPPDFSQGDLSYNRGADAVSKTVAPKITTAGATSEKKAISAASLKVVKFKAEVSKLCCKSNYPI